MAEKVHLRTESRSVELVDAEVKGLNFRGYAAVFDTPWNERLIEETGYEERISRGAFRKALSRSGDVPLLWQHDRHQLLATTKADTLRLSEDGKGLLVEAKLPKNGLGAYAREMIERGDVRGMSYGRLYGPGDTKMEKRDGLYRRLVTGAQRILDVSLTWEPAYTATQVELRSLGFVATPLQELLGGEEPQTEKAVSESPPDDGEPDAWWGDSPADSDGEPDPPKRKWWESYLDEIEREV